ncbi:restriction endonuclease subunit S [Piscinibacter sp.]|uniref:restriction endonuclease subunit S n=1 Tax=Piscinibacter sp. TaxID=1903157 RepID=UPI001D1E1AC1|nr:restriction endonuclease subunit S [Piscinibacter sp.]MBK7532287.1 restriction endonuclease subunit S [Piscinibacter sp.]HOX68985.1 restriction endonuclease subunit S [Burkholderiaceae bacterium]
MTELAQGWITAPLAAVVTIKTGPFGSALHKSDYLPTGIPIVNPMHIRGGLIQPGSDARVGEAKLRELMEFRLAEGDVVLGRRGELGRCAVVGKVEAGWLCGTGSLVLRPNGSVEPRYLQRFLSSPAVVARLEGDSVGSTMVNLNQGILKALEIPMPSLPEQQRIADKLDALLARMDACRHRLDRVPGILERFRQAVLESALRGELSSEWRDSNSVSMLSWRSVTLADVADVGTGSTPLRSNAAFYSSTGTPWVTSAATGLAYVDTAGEFVTPAAVAAHRLKTYPPGTLLVAMYGEGKTRGQVSELRIHATINQACAAVRVDESQASKAFVKLALWAQYEQMRALAEGGNQPNLNLSKIKGLAIRTPPIQEQAEIVRRVESLFALADAIDARYTAARAQVERLTPALLAKAFRGELVPQDPNDEPASALLARLRNPAGHEEAPPARRPGRRPARARAKESVI